MLVEWYDILGVISEDSELFYISKFKDSSSSNNVIFKSYIKYSSVYQIFDGSEALITASSTYFYRGGAI